MWQLVIAAWLLTDGAGLFARVQRLPWYQGVFDAWCDALGVEPGLEVLDVGCGPGGLARVAHTRGARVLGVDRAPKMIERARVDAPTLRWRVGDALALPIPDASVDLTLAASLLNILPERARLLGELARVTRPGGRVSVLFPTPAFASRAPAIVEAEQLSGLSAAALRAWSRRAPALDVDAVADALVGAGLARPRPIELLHGGVAAVVADRV